MAFKGVSRVFAVALVTVGPTAGIACGAGGSAPVSANATGGTANAGPGGSAYATGGIASANGTAGAGSANVSPSASVSGVPTH
jgi:hypothetical protein